MSEDFVWVGIRVFGIYLLVLAILNVPDLVNSAYRSLQLAGAPVTEASASFADSSIQDLYRTVRSNYLGGLVWSVLRLIVCTAFGLYFLRSGELVYRLACRPLGTGEGNSEASSSR